jgi:signal transduction histidine kinase
MVLAGLSQQPVAVFRKRGGFMLDVPGWLRGTPRSGLEANQGPRAHTALGTVIHDIVTKRANHGLLVVTHSLRDTVTHTRLPRAARSRVEELVAAHRRKDEFLAMLGHELRNPLASIQNALYVLSAQTEETSVRQKMQALIERQVRRMTQLVDELSDVSRVTHGRVHLQPEQLDLRDVVNDAIETLGSDIHERGHRLTTAFPDAPVCLQADPGRLEQVFINLLANASKYTAAGGELTVWMHTRDGQAVVRIRDTGIGIAADALPHIFDLFKQADEAVPHSQHGLGIGLALVRNLVELHGGSVTAGSAGPGRGSEFTVRLPL